MSVGMETFLPDPARLTACSLRQDGPMPDACQRQARAASPDAARRGLARSQDRFYASLCRQTQASLAASRRLGGREADRALEDEWARLSSSLRSWRNASLAWSRLLSDGPE